MQDTYGLKNAHNEIAFQPL